MACYVGKEFLMQRLKLYALHALFIFVIALSSFNVLFAIPLRSSLSRNVRIELDFPNDEKEIVVRRITEHVRGEKKISLLYGIQVIDRGRRYYIQDDYHERHFVCRALNFEGAFNEKSEAITIPTIALSEASQVLKFDEEESDLLVPYKSNDQISRLEVLPCQRKS